MSTRPELTRTLESYLQAIFELDEASERVSQAKLARWFRVSPPAASEVVHRMVRMGLIEFKSGHRIVLTDEGRRIAGEMVGRHRLIERFLVDVLHVPWHLVDDEARRMEPGVSPEVEERMRSMLGRADRCPHGNPFPSRKIKSVTLTPLANCEPGSEVMIDRIREDLELDIRMLRYLEDNELLPGVKLKIVKRIPEGGMLVRGSTDVVHVGPVLSAHVMTSAV